MMTVLYNMLGVARYERMMLLRTTRFRLLGGIGLAIPVAVGGLLAILEANGVELESSVGLGAYVPFYIYSYLQAVVIAFIVGDFRAADERAEVYEVVAARPVSTTELVAGKYLGVVGALLTLSLGILALTLAIQAVKISITGTPFAVRPYLSYLMLMNVPALVYMSALTFFLGAVLRRQTAVTLVTIAYGLSVLFFLGRRYGGVYDFGAFFAPLFYSDLIGLGDIERVVELRLFYLALALGFFGLSVDRYPRLKQSAFWAWLGRGMALGGVGLAVGLYFYMEEKDAGLEAYRMALLEEQERYAPYPVARVTHYDMQIDLMADGIPVQGRADMVLGNPHDTVLDTLVLLLNPGLRLKSVRTPSGEEVAWERGMAVIRLRPDPPLAQGAEIRLSLAYEGRVDCNGFDLLARPSQRRLHKGGGPGKGDLTAWVRRTSAFLPPRSRWYPVPGVDYGHENERPVSFSTAELSVSVPKGVEVITQGSPDGREEEGKRARFRWKVTHPVPVFSLNAGNYDIFEARIHEIDCALYLHPAHRRKALFFEDVKEEVTEALEQILDTMEQEAGLAYPYPRLSVVEVPFQVQWYYEGWEEHGGLTQPGILMVEEDVLMRQRFSQQLKWRQRRSRGNDDPKRIKRDLLVGAIFQVFLASEDGRNGVFRSPVVQLWAFDKAFRGEHHALMERAMPLHLQQQLSTGLREAMSSRGRMRGRMGGGGRSRSSGRVAGVEWDTLVTKMQQQSFADLDPKENPSLYRAVLDAKGASLFRMMEAVLGEEGFLTVMENFGEQNRYAEVSFASFERAAVGDSSAGDEQADLQRLVHDWIYGTHVPGFTLTRVKAFKVDDGWGSVVYQVIVRIRNGEPGRGFVQVSVMGRGDEVVKNVEIEGGQEVEVSLVLWERPFRVMVDPFFAKNRRSLMAPLRIPDKPQEGWPESYVRAVSAEDAASSEVVVDNEDEGFSMPIRRVQRYFRPGLKGDNWRVRTMPMAFGRYETNYCWKNGGDGAQPAVWVSELPHTGDYDVAYYAMDPRMWRRFRGAKVFALTVFHGGKVDTLTLERDELKGGWNLLGRFRFEADEEARVELSDRASGRLYADAVRWRYVDPDNPDRVYEEDMPSWEMPGRGGRGGGMRGGGPGGRGGDRF